MKRNRTSAFLRLAPLVLFLALLVFNTACGGGFLGIGGGSDSPLVTVSAAKTSLRTYGTTQLTASVTKAASAAVTWSVNGIEGGNGIVGRIDANGVYTAPGKLPNPNPVMIRATSVADAKSSASAMVTIENPIPALTSVLPTSIPLGNFTLSVGGSNFVNGAVVVWDGQFLTTSFVSATELRATGAASANGTVPITVVNPDPGSAASRAIAVQVGTGSGQVSAQAAARFLEQATWGPTPGLMSSVQNRGFSGFLDGQIAAPASVYEAPGKDEDIRALQLQFFRFAYRNPDQLRQRVAFALSEIMVASANKVTDPRAFVLWQNMFQKDAFGNFSTLLTDVTLSPTMGNYLDMVNNDKPDRDAGTAPNENYAREVMQLFSIGLEQLNPDGTPQLDGNGMPIPTYDQDTIEGFAHTFTGWTYPGKGSNSRFPNPENYSGPMVAFDDHHDTGTKKLLNGVTLSAGGTAKADLTAAIRNIVNHPNVGPFIGRQLIQHLVTSNPSPDYVSRITAVFNDNGKGERGDLRAVVRAILLDPEARRGDDPAQAQADDGHLKEPLLFMMNLLRLGATTGLDACLADYASDMRQKPFFSPSVFNFFHPSHRIEGTNLLGPEFEILDTGTAVQRINFVHALAYGGLCGKTNVDFSVFQPFSGNAPRLVDIVAAVMLHGHMSPDVRAAIVNAVSSIADPDRRIRAAVYLMGSSSQFQVQH